LNKKTKWIIWCSNNQIKICDKSSIKKFVCEFPLYWIFFKLNFLKFINSMEKLDQGFGGGLYLWSNSGNKIGEKGAVSIG
jgi:hypothetical protein